MPQLFFKKVFLEAIRAGRKTTTLRHWAKCRIHPGDRVYTLGLGWLKIDMVESVELAALAEADARADGFDSLADMIKAVEAIYPQHKTDGNPWYRIHFAVDEMTVIPAKGKRRGKHKQTARLRVATRVENRRIGHGEKSALAGFMRGALDKAVAAGRLSVDL